MIRKNGRRTRAGCTWLMLGAACVAGLYVNASLAAELAFDIWQPDKTKTPELKHKPITSVVQTSDGYLWLGTYSGLLRFDGNRVIPFNSSTPGLTNGRITSLYQDQKSV